MTPARYRRHCKYKHTEHCWPDTTPDTTTINSCSKIVSFKYSEHYKEHLKVIFGSVFSHKEPKNIWNFPLCLYHTRKSKESLPSLYPLFTKRNSRRPCSCWYGWFCFPPLWAGQVKILINILLKELRLMAESISWKTKTYFFWGGEGAKCPVLQTITTHLN